MVDLKTAWDVALWRWSRPNPNIKCFTGGNFAGFLTFGYIGERAMWARETRQRYRLRIWKCASCRFFLSTLNVAHFPNINDVTHAEVTEPTEFPRPRISIPVHLSRNPARNNTEHQLPRPIYLVHLFSGWSLVVRGPPPFPVRCGNLCLLYPYFPEMGGDAFQWWGIRSVQYASGKTRGLCTWYAIAPLPPLCLGFSGSDYWAAPWF